MELSKERPWLLGVGLDVSKELALFAITKESRSARAR